MSHLGKGYDINQTFVIEPFDNAIPEFSACTSVYTNFIQSCSGDTSIFLGTGIVSVNGSLSATTVSATTYYGDGSHLTGLITQDTFVTGGTYSNGIATFTNNTGGTFNVIGFYTGATDVFVTGGTYSSGIVTFVNNTGGTFTVSGFTTSFNGGIVSGFTTFTSGLSASTVSATTYYGDGSHLTGLVAQDTFVTGGTYSNGTAIFTNNTGGTFNVSGFTTPFTGGTVIGPTNFISGLSASTLGVSGLTSVYGDIAMFNQTVLYTNWIDDGGLGNGTILNSSFVKVTNNLEVGGNLTATTISATTYENLPRISNIINVAISGGDFTSIADAVDSITGSNSNNRYVIKVAPGRYVEREILMQGKEFISIVGTDILEVLVVASASTQNIFKLGNNNELSFMTISGATNGVGLMCENLDGFSLVHKLSIYDCDTNVYVHSTSANSNFYGEYIDFNGSYSYGTKVLAENGFIAYANMENYYNFPTGPNPTIANSVQGSGATLSVFVGDGIGNGVSGSTNYLLADYASLNTTTTTAEGWDYCLRNVNVGGPCRFDIDSLSVVNSITYDISVEHSGTFGTFNGSSTHTKINTLSENVYWSFLDSEDGELEITRKMSVTFQDGTHTDASTLIFEGSTMGLIEGGVISVVSGLTISVSSGFGYLEKTVGHEIYKRIDFPTTQLTLSPNTNNYIFFNDNSILSASGSAPDSTQNIILGRVVTSASTINFIDASPYNASHTSNGLSTFNRNALGPVYSTGSIVTQNVTPFHLNISSGSYYFSENNFKPSGGTNVSFSQYVRNGSGGWNIAQTNSVVVGYDNNTGSVASLPSSAFTKHTLYVVGQGVNEKYFLVLGQTTYSSLVSAEGADLPTPPSYFDDSVSPIASIYVQQGYSGITQIQDIRPVIGFKAAGVSATAVHANLLGLSADDHTQYLLVNGNRAMSGNLDMGSNNVISAGTFNGVTVESHASRHKNGGADEIATSTPAPSEIPKADTFGKLDSWISDASDSVKGLTQLSVAPVSTPIAVGVNDNRFLKSFTGGSYNNSTSTLSLTSVDGTPYTISGFSTTFTGGTVSGATNFTNGLTANTISATTYYNLPIDVRVTGGTYSNGTATFTNNTGGTFNVSGFTTQFTGGTVSGATNFINGLTASTISATSIYSPFTTGSIIFQGSGGTLTQNNSQLFWDNTNNRLGINTNIPGYTLDAQHIGSTSVTGRLVFRNENNAYSTLALFSNGVGLTLQSHTGGNGYISSNNALNFTAYDSTNPTTIWVGNGARFRIGNSAGTVEYLRISPSGNTLINTSVDSGYNLDVSGTTRLNGLSSVNGVGVANTALAIYGNGTGAGNYIIQGYDASAVQRFYLTASGNIRINGQSDSGTTGTDEKYRSILSFTPSGGTREHLGYWLQQTINQIGGASGITRGIYVNPTLTSAYDYRAIETSGGKVIFGGANQLGSETAKLRVLSGYEGGSMNGLLVEANGNTYTAILRHTGSPTASMFIDATNTGLTSMVRALYINGSSSLANYVTFAESGATKFNISRAGDLTTSGSLYVTGNTIVNSGLTATTISATTYQNLPVTADTFTTGFTYSNNVFTLSRNQGLSSLTALINTMSGLTINGALTVTGTTALNGSITSTALTGTTDRMMEVSSGGTVSASRQIISAYLTSGGTVANLLENTANWDIDGNYIGTAITGTYQGQKHYNGNYLFEAVADNLFIRLIRG